MGCGLKVGDMFEVHLQPLSIVLLFKINEQSAAVILLGGVRFLYVWVCACSPARLNFSS